MEENVTYKNRKLKYFNLLSLIHKYIQQSAEAVDDALIFRLNYCTLNIKVYDINGLATDRKKSEPSCFVNTYFRVLLTGLNSCCIYDLVRQFNEEFGEEGVQCVRCRKINCRILNNENVDGDLFDDDDEANEFFHHMEMFERKPTGFCRFKVTTPTALYMLSLILEEINSFQCKPHQKQGVNSIAFELPYFAILDFGTSMRARCVKCEGDNCNVVLHSKCFETIAKIFFAERKNWKCKNCACKHKSGTLSTSGDIAILRHEIECLNREKQLLNELNDELKSNNNLLKEKLSHTQISYAAKTKMSLPEETARPTTSYSESVKKNRTSAGVIIKTNCSSTTCDDIIADLQKNIKPAELKLCLNGVKKIKNGIIIHCEDKKSQETLEENAKTKLGSKYTVNQTRLWNPRLLIKNVHYKQGTTDDEIMDDLQSLNHIESNEMKLVTKLNYGNTTNLVLEVTPALRNKLTYQGYIYAGWGRCSVTDHLRLVKCYKCSGFVDFEELVVGNNFDIIGVSETWLTKDIPSDFVSIPNFNVYRHDRMGRGGGVAVYVRSSIKCEIMEIGTNSLESIFITFKIGHSSYCVGTFYRPPKENLSESIQLLDNILPALRSEHDELFLLGDFNVNVLADNRLSNCLHAHDLKQVITVPTRTTETSATLLDPIFVNNTECIVESGTLNADIFSDHDMVFCSISSTFKRKPKFVTFRDFKINIDIPDTLCNPYEVNDYFTAMYQGNNEHKYCQSHNLKINPSKSKTILFGNKRVRDNLKSIMKIKIDGEVLAFTDQAKNLGLYIDEDLRFHDHVLHLNFKASRYNAVHSCFVKLDTGVWVFRCSGFCQYLCYKLYAIEIASQDPVMKFQSGEQNILNENALLSDSD
nr:unnamed protein product [Callosobruchus chinensis]